MVDHGHRRRPCRAGRAGSNPCFPVAFEALEPRLLLSAPESALIPPPPDQGDGYYEYAEWVPSTSVTTPSTVQSGNVTITYSVRDVESDSCSIFVEYSPDGGSNWYAASAGPGGDGVSGLTTSPAGTSHTYVWDSDTDLGEVFNDNVRIRITPTDTDGEGTAGSTTSFTVDNDTLPSVEITTPEDPVSGDVTIEYALSDAESDNCSIVVEYSEDGGTTWETATAGTGGDGTTGLTSSPDGTDHTYVWDSLTDLGTVYDTDVQFRITPTDTDGEGDTATSGNFTVDNDALPTVVVTDPTTTQRGQVTIAYTLSDAESDECTILVEYSDDGGTTWYTATAGPGGDGTTGLESSPGGEALTYVWDSTTDIGLEINTDVQIRITPNDGHEDDGTEDTTATFTVDNEVEADIFWRNQTYGLNSIWLMDGGDVAQGMWLPPFGGAGWRVTGTGDFDGDGDLDILWHSDTYGYNAIWLLQDGNIDQALYLPTITDSAWSVAGIGDFDGDGYSDILWRYASLGVNVIWFTVNGAYDGGLALPNVVPGWSVVGTGDFDADGKSDILWRYASTGTNVIWFMAGGVSKTRLLATVVPGWTVGGTGDFDGDDDSDILWRYAPTGLAVVWRMESGYLNQSIALATAADSGWSFAGAGDFDGDEDADILWRHGTVGANVVWLMEDGNITGGQALPAIADTAWRVIGVGDGGSQYGSLVLAATMPSIDGTGLSLDAVDAGSQGAGEAAGTSSNVAGTTAATTETGPAGPDLQVTEAATRSASSSASTGSQLTAGPEGPLGLVLPSDLEEGLSGSI